MNKFQTFQDIENFLVDYNQDGTPINKETYIYKFVKKKPIKHYKYINFKIISLFTIILLFIFIFIYNYLLLNKRTTQLENIQTELQIAVNGLYRCSDTIIGCKLRKNGEYLPFKF